MVNTDTLNPDRIFKNMADALPSHPPAPPYITDTFDVIGLFFHACMISTGFKFTGYGKEHLGGLEWVEKRFSEEELQSLGSSLPRDWNKWEKAYYFTYTHPSTSSMEIALNVGMKKHTSGRGAPDRHVIEIQARSARATVNFQTENSSRSYVNSDELPLRMPREETDFQDRKDIRVLVANLFKERELGLLDLIKRFRNTMPPVLTGTSRLQESSETAPVTNAAERGQDTRRSEQRNSRDGPPPPYSLDPPAQPRPFDDPLQPVPRRPVPAGDFPPPDFEDEYEMNRTPRTTNPPVRNGPPFGIGHDDLYPQGLGPHDPLRPSLTDPSRGIPGSGGMHPTFDDPLFRGDLPSRGFSPQVPPGARYDPTGPGDTLRPTSGRRRFVTNPWENEQGLGDGLGGGPQDPFGNGDNLLPQPPGGLRGPPFNGGFPNMPGNGGGFGGGLGGGFGGGGFGGGGII